MKFAWFSWLMIIVVVFIVIVLWSVVTPAYNTLSDTLSTQVNLTHSPTNTSFHELRDGNNNMWNMWPLAFVGIALLMFFVVSTEDEKE